MDTAQVNSAVVEIIEKRVALEAMGYDDERYDDLEDSLHDLEDDFLEKYGDNLEAIIEGLHDEHFPETDVLSPISYIGQEYFKVGSDDNGDIYECDQKQGVNVEMEKLPNARAHLVFLPNPLRLVLHVGQTQRVELWPGNTK